MSSSEHVDPYCHLACYGMLVWYAKQVMVCIMSLHVWEVFSKHTPPGIRRLRFGVITATFYVTHFNMAFVAYFELHLAGQKVVHQLFLGKNVFGFFFCFISDRL